MESIMRKPDDLSPSVTEPSEFHDSVARKTETKSTMAVPSEKPQHDNEKKKPERNATALSASRRKKCKNGGKSVRRARAKNKGGCEMSGIAKDEESSESSSEYSEELIVYETPENQSYQRKVTIGLLSRVGFREQYWDNKIVAYLVILSYLITYDTISLFFLFSHMFGVFFTINYSICMLLIGFPMCYLEMALGQYTSTGIYLVFDRMVPGFVGVAISALLVNCLNIIYNHNILVDVLAILAHAGHITSGQKPWDHCVGGRVKKGCYAWPRSCSEFQHSKDRPRFPTDLAFSASESFDLVLIGDTCVQPATPGTYYDTSAAGLYTTESVLTTPLMNYVYNDIEDFYTWKKKKYPTAEQLRVSAIVLFLFIYILTRNIKTIAMILSRGVVITFCVMLFLLHFTIITVRPNYPYALPVTKDLSEALFNISGWTCAMILTIRSLKLGQGAWTFFGSLFGFRNNVLLDCLTLTVFMIFVTFFYSLIHIIIIDSHFLERTGGARSPADRILCDQQSIFRMNPFSVAILFLESLHTFDVYRTVATFGYCLALAVSIICNKIVCFLTIISAITEMNVTFTNRSSHVALVIVMVLFATMCQMSTLAENGYVRSTFIRRCILSIAYYVIVLCELFVIGIFYGFRVVFMNTFMMVFNAKKEEGKRWKLIINSAFLILWSAVIPLAVLFSLIKSSYTYIGFKHSPMDKYTIATIIAILLPIPAMLLHRMYEQYRNGCSFMPLFKRNPDLWGPRMRSHRSEAERVERMIRKFW